MTTRAITRRHLLFSASAAALLTGCATAFPDQLAAERWPPIGRLLRADGLTVHAWERGPSDDGGGGAPAILIHGASGNVRDWSFAIGPQLARTRRVVAFDRPGFGYSERAAQEGWDIALQAQTLRAATRVLQVEKPILIGHSLGAAVAMAWAVEHPDEVSGVVVISGVTMPYTGAAQVFGALGVDSLIASIYSEYLKSTVEDGGVERFVARVFRPQTPPPGYVEYVGGPLALREATLMANAEDITGLNDGLLRMAPSYPSFQTPVEIIHGAEDFISAEKQAEPLAATLPNARLTVLPGVGHMAHHASPETIEAALRRIDRAQIIDA